MNSQADQVIYNKIHGSSTVDAQNALTLKAGRDTYKATTCKSRPSSTSTTWATASTPSAA